MQKIALTSSTRSCIVSDIFLGYEGENEANKLVFSFTDGFVNGMGILNLQRGEEVGYVSLNKVGETYEFPVKNSVLSKEGEVKFQVVINTNDGMVIKYDPFTMVVKDAIDTDTEMPEDYPSWVDMANSKLAEVDKAIENVETVTNQLIEDKENGVFNGKDGIDGKNGTDGKDGVNGKDGKDGEDGFSPSAKVVQTDTGAVITIEDKDGTTSAIIKHGAGGGEGGGTGADGFSPIANVTQTSNGAKITITDKSGTTTAEVFNGKDGEDGITPVKGIDYFDGKNGEDGITPHIGENGNWWIGEEDTGVPATGSGGGTGGTGTPSVIKEIFSGNADVAKTNYTLTESIENFDFVLVFGKHDGVYDNSSILIPVSKITADYSQHYHIGADLPNTDAGTTISSMAIRFRFIDNVTFNTSNILAFAWKNVGIYSIYGIKLGSGGGSSYSETELLSSPVEYAVTDGVTSINSTLVLNDSLDKYDEVWFKLDSYYGSTSKYIRASTMPILVSQIIFNNSNVEEADGSQLLLSSNGYKYNCTIGCWFKNNTEIYISNTACGQSSLEITKIRIKSIKGIKR